MTAELGGKNLDGLGYEIPRFDNANDEDRSMSYFGSVLAAPLFQSTPRFLIGL